MASLTQHAQQRCQQRGIKRERLLALLEHADVDKPVGRNCRLLRLSRKNAENIRGGEQLSCFGAIISDITGEIVTVLHIGEGRRGRWYRRAA